MTKENYELLLKLKYPRTTYCLTGLCEGLNIEDTFFDAVEWFNTRSGRKKDGLNISYKSIHISEDSISCMLSADKDFIKDIKHIGNIIGSGISKRLFHDYHWQKLSTKDITSDFHALFDVTVIS